MQIHRLFEMTYLLLNKRKMTAKELAERFEVSQRTIYRDVDTLSAAGIPIYASKGKGGGISLLEDFVLNKSVLSEDEQNEILFGLQSLSAVKYPEVDTALSKLGSLFRKENIRWIDVDFTDWGAGVQERAKFMTLKDGILNKSIILFDYYSAAGEKTTRKAEPLRLMFRGQGWYLLAFCTAKQDYRFFKLSRIKNLKRIEETFEREIPCDVFQSSPNSYRNKMVPLRLWVDATMAYRVYDEFEEENIVKHEDGSFTVTTEFPLGEWVYGYLLSFGGSVRVLQPTTIRDEIIRRLQTALKQYL
ncbi:YafY family protein [Hydrogenoanaerobacterium sp.]|uniref:helix-turn-helix transcriptional regulator n=1 Tax=Hydrogenoanaerobacterium sp. TaxID=2953763 RepID=UPI002897B325|nr:YafY family protein [Hydrogenoanaerobacterium sp.]